MACKLIFSQEAERELDAIIAYHVDTLCNPRAALVLLDEIEAKLRAVYEAPTIHAISREPQLALYGYRVVPVRRYLVLCKLENDEVRVAHVFHGSQNCAQLI